MKSFTVLLCAVCLNSATPLAWAETTTIIRDPNDDSLWITKEPDLDAQHLVARWSEASELELYSEPFTPFNFNDPRLEPIFTPTVFGLSVGGEPGLVMDYRGLYRRSGDGWALTDAFSTLPSLGCRESTTSSLCLFYQTGIDHRGVPFVSFFDELGVLRLRFWDGAAYRDLVGVERNFDNHHLYNAQHVIWTDDREAAIWSGNYTDDGRIHYGLATKAGYKLIYAGDADNMGGETQAHWRSGSYYVAVKGYSTDERAFSLWVVRDPVHQPEHADRLYHAKAPRTEFRPLGIDDEYYYVQADHQISAVRLVNGSTHIIGSWPKCTALAFDLDQHVEGAWVACGRTLLQLLSGQIKRSMAVAEAGDMATGGQVLADRNGRFDVVAWTSSGQFIRWRDDQALARVSEGRLLSAGSELEPVWDEPPGPCGQWRSDTPGGAKIGIVCQVNGTWHQVPLPFSPLATKFDGTSLWALGANDHSVGVWRRQIADGVWTSVQEIPAAFPGRARFLASPTEIVVDVESKGVWINKDGSFDEQFTHDHRALALVPGLDVEGNLYDHCPDHELRLCRYRADGGVAPVVGPAPARGHVLPLKRGAILVNGDDGYVLRNGKSIALGQLFGQFRPLPQAFQQLEFNPLDNGSVHIRRAVHNGERFIYAYYLFDGRVLTTLREHVILDFKFDTADFQPLGGGATQVGRTLWRANHSDRRGVINYGETPTEALYPLLEKNGNQVKGALVDGDSIVATNHEGLWSCALDQLTAVSATTSVLPRARSCRLLAALPMANELFKSHERYYVGRGGDVYELPPNGVAKRLNNTVATFLSVADAQISWLEGSNWIGFDPSRRTKKVVAVPTSATPVKASHGDWLCGNRGIWVLATESFLQVSSRPCLSVLRKSSREAFALTVDGFTTCRIDAPCDTATPLPAPYLPDTRLGSSTAVEQPLLAIGSTLYQWSTDHFVDVTPRYQERSLLLTAVERIDHGVLSLAGGGAVVLPHTGDPEQVDPLHLRLQ